MSRNGSEAWALEVDEVTRRFGQVTAVDRASLRLEHGEVVTLLGPSGCGKTTMLRLIAGFESPDSGRILFDGTDVTARSPQRRGFGMVFQNYALFPHLDVFENVAFGLRSRNRPRPEIEERVRRALERVDMAEYGARSVQALSGGQQQRVALARALAIEPPLLLLDEPLSNLDQALRVRTRAELRRLVKELGITTLFVTHDQEEAFDLADRIAVMSRGRIRQIGTPRELYEEPADRFVAGFVGSANWIPVEVVGPSDPRSLAVRLPGGPVWTVPTVHGDGTGARGVSGGQHPGSGPGPAEGALLLVRPEDLRFATEGEEEALPGTLLDRRFRGAFTLYRVRVAEGELEMAGPAVGPGVGDPVRLRPREGATLHLYPRGAPEDGAS